jgi:hypothetical protein
VKSFVLESFMMTTTRFAQCQKTRALLSEPYENMPDESYYRVAAEAHLLKD